jgi:hypothetical protein
VSTRSSELTVFALDRLTRALGPAAAPEAAREAFESAGIAELSSPKDLLAFAERLIARGGAFEAVGRGLKVSALLRGATP